MSPLPRHIAIIMDGNGRWANQRGLTRIEGHKVGAEVARAITECCSNLGVEQLTLFCFSSENWKRPKEELDFLMQLFVSCIIAELPMMMANNIQACFIGRREGMPESVLREMEECETRCAPNTGMRLALALNYGSRSEIVDAVKSVLKESIEKKTKIEEIDAIVDETSFSDRLYTAGMPDPDLLIRTAGEMRLSNFLLWQLSYSEIWVTPVFWPDFSEATLHEALADYAKRDRRYGGLSQKRDRRYGGLSQKKIAE